MGGHAERGGAVIISSEFASSSFVLAPISYMLLTTLQLTLGLVVACTHRHSISFIFFLFPLNDPVFHTHHFQLSCTSFHAHPFPSFSLAGTCLSSFR
jgi:hypothetical protein